MAKKYIDVCQASEEKTNIITAIYTRSSACEYSDHNNKGVLYEFAKIRSKSCEAENHTDEVTP